MSGTSARNRRRLRSLFGRRAAAVTGATALVAAGLVGVAAQPASAFIICPANVNTFVWDGNANDTPGHVGDNRNWDNAYNWDVDCTPGLRNQPHDDVVTIPAGADVFINDGQSADVAALTNNATLTVTPFGALMVYGSSTSSVLKLQGILGGPGQFVVTNELTWTSTTQGASTQLTRRCDLVSCAAPAPVAGVTVINPGAKLVINGRGVNLSDQRIIENHGSTTVSGLGYIAADYGTSFRNVRGAGAVQPRFAFANDGGYYQGFAIAGFGLSTFDNSGLLAKTGGSGVSVVDAQYTSTAPGSTYTGTTQVKSGTLTIVTASGKTVRKAKVQQGATFGNGGPPPCDPLNQPGSCAVVAPTGDDPEVATVQLTKPGTTSSTVTIQEVTWAQAVAGQRGVPVRIETSTAVSEVTAPLRFRILLDSTLLLPGETPAIVAANAVVARQATNAVPYVALPDCDASGNPSQANPSCVARTLSATETAALGNGDVVIVISSLVNSRYRVSKVGAA
jgi:hypothetical protein